MNAGMHGILDWRNKLNFVFGSSQYQVQAHNKHITNHVVLQATMLKKSKSKFKRRNTEPSIYFPNEAVSQTQQSQQGPQSPEDSCEVHHDWNAIFLHSRVFLNGSNISLV